MRAAPRWDGEHAGVDSARRRPAQLQPGHASPSWWRPTTAWRMCTAFELRGGRLRKTRERHRQVRDPRRARSPRNAVRMTKSPIAAETRSSGALSAGTRNGSQNARSARALCRCAAATRSLPVDALLRSRSLSERSAGSMTTEARARTMRNCAASGAGSARTGSTRCIGAGRARAQLSGRPLRATRASPRSAPGCRGRRCHTLGDEVERSVQHASTTCWPQSTSCRRPRTTWSCRRAAGCARRGRRASPRLASSRPAASPASPAPTTRYAARIRRQPRPPSRASFAAFDSAARARSGSSGSPRSIEDSEVDAGHGPNADRRRRGMYAVTS